MMKWREHRQTMLSDLHTHTKLCHHAVGEPEDYVRSAIAKGLGEIGFSDHNPMPTQFDESRMAGSELPLYFEMIERTKKAFPDFPIRLALECDFLQGYEDHIRWLATQTEWDYFIGSVHYLRDWEMDNPAYLEKWKEQPLEVTWKKYFEEYQKAAESRLFDFLGHPDLVKKFCFVPQGDLKSFYRPALDAIADCGVAIEVNTAGLRKDIKEIYPSKGFLEEAFKRHIPILINSDAHAPQEVGMDFDKALTLVKEVGYTTVQRFEKRKRIEVRLP